MTEDVEVFREIKSPVSEDKTKVNVLVTGSYWTPFKEGWVDSDASYELFDDALLNCDPDRKVCVYYILLLLLLQ